MTKTTLCGGALLASALAISAAVSTNAPLPFLSPMFGDGMVLQRDKPNTIWGWSAAGTSVQVEIAGHQAKATAGADGRWQLKIDPPAAGGPYTIIIDGTQHLQLHNVLVGDVWLCGGQSNMELPLERTRNGSNEIAAANRPNIRLFKVHSHVAYSPSAIPQGEWKVCSPKTIIEDGGFSAVGYFYACRIQDEMHVPIGLVEDCLGGTPAEAWTSAATLRGLKDFDRPLAETERIKSRGGPEYGNYVMHWYDDYDIGLKQNWMSVTVDNSDWKPVQIPGGFSELGLSETPGVCWLHKEIMLPNKLPQKNATIYLGEIERMDTTYINGQWIGGSAWSENPRVYTVRNGVLKPGRNVVAVRVFKTKPRGGFLSSADTLRLALGDGTTIPLAGEWRGAVSVDARPPHPMPLGFENWPVMPSVLYQGMIEPVAPLAITGTIWYQGEANADRPVQYRKLLPAVIGDWRTLFGQGDFPFYIVSLPAFMHHQDKPGQSGGWADIREAQAMTATAVKNSALAVTIDTGDPDNIHPSDKKIVGERLALCALSQHYGKKIQYQGPTFKSLEHIKGALRIHFDHADGGLISRDGPPAEFSIAGKDHQWHWADAKIDGDTVVVSSAEVPEPEQVRYAWQSFPKATVYNGAGLPAVPFRTDSE